MRIYKSLVSDAARLMSATQAEHSEMHVALDNQRVAAIYPNGEAAVIEGAGHNLAYENTAFTIKLVRDFITRKRLPRQ